MDWMTDTLLFGFGFVAIIEGLVLALAPSLLQEALEILRRLSVGRSRVFGLAAVGVGVLMVWAGKS